MTSAPLTRTPRTVRGVCRVTGRESVGAVPSPAAAAAHPAAAAAAGTGDRVPAAGVQVPTLGVGGVKLHKSAAAAAAVTAAIPSKGDTMSDAANTAATAATAATSKGDTMNAPATAAATATLSALKAAANAAAAAVRPAAAAPRYVTDRLTLTAAAWDFAHPSVNVTAKAVTRDGDLILRFKIGGRAKGGTEYYVFGVNADGPTVTAAAAATFKDAQSLDTVTYAPEVALMRDLCEAGKLPSKSKLRALHSRCVTFGVSVSDLDTFILMDNVSDVIGYLDDLSDAMANVAHAQGAAFDATAAAVRGTAPKARAKA